MATMQDIADKCGVSKGTVSKALNGASDISDALRKVIIETAIDMGYNRTIHLANEKKLAIFIGNSKLTSPQHFGYNIIQSFKKEALTNGFNVDVYTMKHINDSEKGYDEFMLGNKYSGGFFLSIDDRENWLEQLPFCKTPAVLLDKFIPNNDILSAVGIDTLEGVTKIVRFLFNQGHRKIGYLSSYASSEIYQQRFHSYLMAMDLFNLEVETKQIGLEERSLTCIHKHFKNVYDTGCTAIICSHDSLAHSLMLHCKDMDISIPNDLSIVGIDDIEMSSHSSPPLTTLRQDQEILGNAAFHAVINQINGVPMSRLLIHSKLIVRDSVKNLNEK